MTNDRSRKADIRARMAATGEPYSVAARNLANTTPAPTGPPSGPLGWLTDRHALIGGRAGSGKTHLLRLAARAALEVGLDVNVIADRLSEYSDLPGIELWPSLDRYEYFLMRGEPVLRQMLLIIDRQDAMEAPASLDHIFRDVRPHARLLLAKREWSQEDLKEMLEREHLQHLVQESTRIGLNLDRINYNGMAGLFRDARVINSIRERGTRPYSGAPMVGLEGNGFDPTVETVADLFASFGLAHDDPPAHAANPAPAPEASVVENAHPSPRDTEIGVIADGQPYAGVNASYLTDGPAILLIAGPTGTGNRCSWQTWPATLSTTTATSTCSNPNSPASDRTSVSPTTPVT